jgi:hypothetical protein
MPPNNIAPLAALGHWNFDSVLTCGDDPDLRKV